MACCIAACECEIDVIYLTVSWWRGRGGRRLGRGAVDDRFHAHRRWGLYRAL